MDSHSSIRYLANHEGQIVEIEGICSEIMWQHIFAFIPEYSHHVYFDLDDGTQIIVYSKVPIVSKNRLAIRGKVFSVSGGSALSLSSRHSSQAQKNSETRETKVDENYREYHLIAESWREVRENKDK